MGQTPNGTDATQRLFVGNLSAQATEDRLRSMVGKFGTVKDVYLVRGAESGVVLGFAFVQMDDAQGAVRAIEGLNGVEIDGRTLKVRQRF